MRKLSLVFMLLIISTALFAQENRLNKFFQYFIDNDYEKARVVLEQKISENPRDGERHFYLGKTYLALKKNSRAMKEFALALKNGYRTVQLFRMQGQTYDEQGLLADAIEAYILALNVQPHTHLLRIKLASLYYRQLNYSNAIRVLRQFFATDSTNLQAYYLLGRSFLKQEQYDSTLSVSGKAIKLDSTHVPNLLNLSVACFEKGRLDSAARYLESATRLSPKADEATYYLAKSGNVPANLVAATTIRLQELKEKSFFESSR